ncbi:MAG: hypothetical protein U0V72_01470 [Cytophagales bacterium]
MNINQKVDPSERHYEVINLAKDQITKVHSISDDLLQILAFDSESKINAINVNNAEVEAWERSQDELKELIDRSKIDTKDKDAVYDMYETCHKFMNKFKNAQTFVSQKADVGSMQSTFNNLVKKNEEGYISKMNELIAVYQKAEEDKLQSQKIKNYLMFGIGLVFVIMNILIFITPAKKIIFGEKE